MEPVIISWTPTNWITIFLMAAGGFLVLMLTAQGVKAIANRGGASA